MSFCSVDVQNITAENCSCSDAYSTIWSFDVRNDCGAFKGFQDLLYIVEICIVLAALPVFIACYLLDSDKNPFKFTAEPKCFNMRFIEFATPKNHKTIDENVVRFNNLVKLSGLVLAAVLWRLSVLFLTRQNGVTKLMFTFEFLMLAVLDLSPNMNIDHELMHKVAENDSNQRKLWASIMCVGAWFITLWIFIALAGLSPVLSGEIAITCIVSGALLISTIPYSILTSWCVLDKKKSKSEDDVQKVRPIQYIQTVRAMLLVVCIVCACIDSYTHGLSLIFGNVAWFLSLIMAFNVYALTL